MQLKPAVGLAEILSESGPADPFNSTSSLQKYDRMRSHCFTLTGAL